MIMLRVLGSPPQRGRGHFLFRKNAAIWITSQHNPAIGSRSAAVWERSANVGSHQGDAVAPTATAVVVFSIIAQALAIVEF